MSYRSIADPVPTVLEIVRAAAKAALIMVTLAPVLTACSTLSSLTEEPEATLADLPAANLSPEQEELPRVSLQELADIYQDVLLVTADPATRLQVKQRLADIELLGGEASLAEASYDGNGESHPGGESFSRAIGAYETLLRENPQNPHNDQLLYQLSKAYEFSGDNTRSLAVLEKLSTDYPDSNYYLEAEFRRAESYFVATDYRAAEQAYGNVIAAGQDTSYYVNAQYMQGWARFKQGRYSPAIAAFTATLDRLMPADNRVSGLPPGEGELVQDCLRVLAVMFSNLEGGDSIASAYNELGVRPYQHLLYQALGGLYLSQERYRDSAETYKAYTRTFPDSKVAHQMQLRVIESYEAGRFPQLIVEAKQHYIEMFGVSGSYWAHSSDNARDAMRAQLKLFIGELASYYHALAQDVAAKEARPGLAVQRYRLAGAYYQRYIDSFPLDEHVPEMGFLLAESLYEAGDYASAIEIYEWVAYDFTGYERSADAAYAAVLAYDQLQESSQQGAAQSIQLSRIDSELRFAAGFSSDQRAPAVLNQAAAALVELGDYQGAIIAAVTLIKWQPRPAEDIVVAAQLVMGHSHFELQQYDSAEQAYRAALALMPAADTRYPGVMDALAASVYRQAELAVAGGDHLQAAQQFARVSALAPGSSISVNAQYDAANNYMQAGELVQANRLLVEFRQRHPDHALSAGVTASLVANYEQLQQWDAAAAELDRLHDVQTDSEGQRQTLYLSAEYYERAGDQQRAIARYRSYAHNWPQPMALRMEAMHRLAQLYKLSRQEPERQFWLQEIVATYDGAGEQQSERSRFLAASSSSVLADAQYQVYSAIKLQYPLKQSFKLKNAAMQRTLDAYKKSGAYGVQEFSTQASYRMARVYQQLGSDLMASERPADIDELALEQYEFMLEEQAYPFEEKAIAIHESNARLSWDGVYDDWVRESFVALAELLPARYQKVESGQAPDHVIDAEPEQARIWFDQQLASGRVSPKSYNQYAIYLRQQGQFSGAERVYLDALAVDQLHADTHRNIGILYDLYRGERQQALDHYHNYQQLTGTQDRAVAGWIADLERQANLLVRGN